MTSLAVLQRDTGVDKQLPLDALAIVFAAKTKKVNFQRRIPEQLLVHAGVALQDAKKVT